MTIGDLVKHLDLEVKSCLQCTEREVNGAYVSDLLSDVMAHGKENNIWITLQTHLNVVAVSSMKAFSGIIIVNGRHPGDETVKRAEEEGVFIAIAHLTAFEVAGRLYQLLHAEEV